MLHGNVTSRAIWPSIIPYIPYIVAGFVLGLFISASLPKTPPVDSTPFDPSYKPRAGRSCSPPPIINYDYPATSACVQLISSTPVSLRFRLTFPAIRRTDLPLSYAVHLVARTDSSTHGAVELFFNDTIAVNNAAYDVYNLVSDSDYTLVVFATFTKPPLRVQLCIAHVTTCASPYNFVRNPSFESAAEPPYISTHSLGDRTSPRQWTPFYDGGARRLCGAILLTTDFQVEPRSGNCALMLGRLPSDWAFGASPRHYGAYQGVAVNGSGSGVFVSAWYMWIPSKREKKSKNENSSVKATLVVAWTFADGALSDGVSVELLPSARWTPICVVVAHSQRNHLRAVHVFTHLDVAEELSPGNRDDVMLIDDVAVWTFTDSDKTIPNHQACYSVPSSAPSPVTTPLHAPYVHLHAENPPTCSTLTLAVPLTADRVLRLETLSRQYGGGAIAAAVVVRDELELRSFILAWATKTWLRAHVDVTFVRQYSGGALAINALRNIAVALARSEFVAMLDVDMTPAPDSFACIRGNGSSPVLRSLLPPGRRRLLALAVFLTDVHQRAAQEKSEIENALRQGVASAYCITSQRGSKLRQWHGGNVARRTRFLADYEPYVIARRDNYPQYDERFSGYGFNKIAWLLVADAAGWEVLALNDVFVTHLNHVENDWVSKINEEHYIQIWRRYLGLAAEVNDLSISAIESVRLIDSTHKDNGNCTNYYETREKEEI